MCGPYLDTDKKTINESHLCGNQEKFNVAWVSDGFKELLLILLGMIMA